MVKIRKSLSVIIPFYNEEKTLLKVLKQVLKREEVYEVIAVNDGSRDNSAGVLKKFLDSNKALAQKVKVLSHRQNMGKGAAIITGIKAANGQFVIIQDADLEYNPENYPKLMAPLFSGRADFVLSNRWGSNQRGYLLAQLGNRYMNFVTYFLFGVSLSDCYACYKVGPASLWRKLRLTSSGFEIEVEIIVRLAKLKCKIDEVPIDYTPRTFAAGKKINWKDVIKGTLTLAKLRILS